MKHLGRISFLIGVVVTAGAVAQATPPATSNELVMSEHDNEQRQPQVAFNWHHGEYLVVWHDDWGGGRDVYARRVSKLGQVLAEFPVNTEPNGSILPAVAYNPVNDEYLVVWMHDFAGDGSDYDVHGRRIPWNGPSPALPELVINGWMSSQWSPRVAWSDTSHEYLVVWSNIPPSGPASIDAQRVYPSGTLLGSAFSVASGAEPRVNPDIAYNQARNEYLVTYDVYRTSLDVGATRLAVNGTPIGGEIMAAGGSDDEEHAAVAAAAAADGYVVTWQSWQPVRKVYARLLHGDGTLLLAPFLIADSSFHNGEPDVACDPNLGRCLVAWMGQFSDLTGRYGVFARTIDFSGFVGDVAILRTPIIDDTVDTAEPTIAAAQVGWLVTWEHRRNGTGYWDVHGRMVWQLFADGFESGSAGQW